MHPAPWSLKMNLKALSLSVAILITTNLSADTKKPKPAGKTAEGTVHTVSKAKTEAIRKLLEANGVLEANLTGTREAIKAMMKNSPNVDPKFWSELESKVSAGAFSQILVAIYDHNYSLEEIIGLTKFFGSPLGKAYLEKNTTIQTETGRSLRVYMEENSKELMKKYPARAPKADSKKN